MDNTVTALESGPLSDQLQRVVLGSHAKLERQGSKGSKGCPTPSRQVMSPLGNRVDSEKQSDDPHGLLSIVSRHLNVLISFQNILENWGTSVKDTVFPSSDISQLAATTTAITTVIVLPALKWLVLLTMCHHIRIQASSRGGRSQSGELGQRRTTTPPWQRGVGSKTKEDSGAPSRNCSRRSKNTATCTSLCHQWSYRTLWNERLGPLLFSQRGWWEERQERRENTWKPKQRWTRCSGENRQTSGDESRDSCVNACVPNTQRSKYPCLKKKEEENQFSWNAVVNLLITFPPHLESPVPTTYIDGENISFYILLWQFTFLYLFRSDETCQDMWRFYALVKIYAKQNELFKMICSVIDNQFIYSISLTSSNVTRFYCVHLLGSININTFVSACLNKFVKLGLFVPDF